MTEMTNEDFRRIFAEAEARNAADPHGMGESQREVRYGSPEEQHGAYVVCNCGRRFEAASFARAMSNQRRHANREAVR